MDFSATMFELVNGIAPAITGGLVALAGTIVLFWMQQSAQRRNDRRRRTDEAFDRFMDYCGYLSAQLRTPHGELPFNRWEVFERGWRFTWTLSDKDQPVGTWAMQILIGSVTEVAKAERGSEDFKAKLIWAEENMNLAVQYLSLWKRGRIKRSWFAKQLRKHLDEKPDAPSSVWKS